jgi:hypothetical protein
MADQVILTRHWEGAVDWMADYIDDHTPEEVAGMLIHLASNVSDEVIEDLFREEMDADDYFDEVTGRAADSCPWPCPHAKNVRINEHIFCLFCNYEFPQQERGDQ